MSLDPIGKLPYASDVLLADGGQMDAFNRLRVSEMVPIWDSKQIFDNQPLLIDDQQTSGSGTTSTHSAAKAASTMSVSASTAGTRIRQSIQSFNYAPGKGMLIIQSANLRATGGGAGITARVGYFRDSDGLFFQVKDGVISVNLRSNATGTPVTTTINQNSWNIDKMDGTGPSGETLDITKSQLFIIDYEWQGVGRARMGFFMNGQYKYVHHFRNENAISGVYMSTPNLPLRWSISNDGTGAASTMLAICGSIASEGGTRATGLERHFAAAETSNIGSGSNRALLAFRLKTGRQGAVIEVSTLGVIGAGNGDKGAWRLTLNPTVSGTALSYTGQTNSSIEIAQPASNNTISGGTVIDGGYFTDGGAGLVSVLNALKLGQKIDGTRDFFVLSAIPITNNINVQGSVTWLELT